MIVWKFRYSIATVICIVLFQSCDYFETKKISSQEFLQEELKSIRWNEVDTYPVFESCKNISEKERLKACFQQTLTVAIYRSIASLKKPVKTTINDTLQVHFTVSKEAKLEISKLVIDSLLQSQLPEMEQAIFQTIDSLQPIAPAYKRGIPVTTTFILPIKVVTD